MKTNLVICCWAGLRRYIHPPTIKNRTYFLERQVEQLNKLKHSLTQITFVVPDYQLESIEYSCFLGNLPEEINGAKVVVLRKPNLGMSYGSFNYAYEKYRTEFDYYFFLEDDYFFVLNDFDKILIQERIAKDAGYICMQRGNGGGVYKMHAAVPMGCIDSKIAELVWNVHGELPHAKDPTNYTANEAGQVEFGNAFELLGHLDDLMGTYALHLSFLGKLHSHNTHLPDLIVPIQRLEEYD